MEGPISDHPRSDVDSASPGIAVSVRRTLEGLRSRSSDPSISDLAPIRTGFHPLDRVLDGGLRRHDLMLLGGSPGVGKTVAALQMARHTAMHDRAAVYVSYEHDSPTMLGRLLTMELGEMADIESAPELDRLRDVVVQATAGFRSIDEAIRTEPLLARAAERVEVYADRLLLVRASGRYTDLASLEVMLENTGASDGGLLVVDYLQKVAIGHEEPTEAEKVTHVTEGLKDLALSSDLAVIALAAGDWAGVQAGRMRLHHLRGSSALAYECDIAILMNEKYQAVSRDHLIYDTVRAESYRHQVVFTIEKNRGGPAMVDLEFRKDFLHYRFDPRGAYLTERLVDDRLAPA